MEINKQIKSRKFGENITLNSNNNDKNIKNRNNNHKLNISLLRNKKNKEQQNSSKMENKENFTFNQNVEKLKNKKTIIDNKSKNLKENIKKISPKIISAKEEKILIKNKTSPKIISAKEEKLLIKNKRSVNCKKDKRSFKIPLYRRNEDKTNFSEEEVKKRIKINSIELYKKYKSFNFKCSNFIQENKKEKKMLKNDIDKVRNFSDNNFNNSEKEKQRKIVSSLNYNKNEGNQKLNKFILRKSNTNVGTINNNYKINNVKNNCFTIIDNKNKLINPIPIPNTTRNNQCNKNVFKNNINAKNNNKYNPFNKEKNLEKIPNFNKNSNFINNNKEISNPFYVNKNIQNLKENNLTQKEHHLKNEHKINLKIDTEYCNSNKENISDEFKALFNLNKFSQQLSDPQINFQYHDDFLVNLNSEEILAKFSLQNHKSINENIRNILVKWIIEVHKKFKLNDNSLYQAIYLIDFCRNKAGDLFTPFNYQLLGITALFISCKVEEIYFPDIRNFIAITDNSFNKLQIIEMEFLIMKTIDYTFYTCYNLRFLEIYKNIFEMDLQEFSFCKYCLETTLLDEGFREYHNSTVTLCVIFSYLKIHTNSSQRKKEINSKVFFLLNNRNSEFKDCLKKMVRHLDTWISGEDNCLFKQRYEEDCKKMRIKSI